MYDVRELQGLTDDDDKGSLVGSLERDKGVLLEDPRWQGNYMYKFYQYHLILVRYHHCITIIHRCVCLSVCFSVYVCVFVSMSVYLCLWSVFVCVHACVCLRTYMHTPINNG